MSDGSRDQLYLALRLATLEQHLDQAEPMPFVVDDILIGFDDRHRHRSTNECQYAAVYAGMMNSKNRIHHVCGFWCLVSGTNCRKHDRSE
jgi:hypothetical protein